MIGIERNKDPELSPKERNTSYFVILDDRKHGRSGKFPVFYDVDTGDYLEPPEGFLESQFQTLKEWYNVQGNVAQDVARKPEPLPDAEPTPEKIKEEIEEGEVFTGLEEEEAPF